MFLSPLGETDDEVFGPRQGFQWGCGDDDSDATLICFQCSGVHGRCRVFGHGAVECRSDGAAHLIVDDKHEVPCRFAGRLIQVWLGVAMKVYDPKISIDSNGCRHMPCQQCFCRQGCDGRLCTASGLVRRNRTCHWNGTYEWEIDISRTWRPDATKQPGLLVDGFEHLFAVGN